jgi:large subunit ribosomal protein L3
MVTVMPLGMLGLKVGMTQVYDEQGRIHPVTVLQVGPNPVLQIKVKGDKDSGSARMGKGDGYFAVQIGFLDKDRERATKPERGHVSAQMESKRKKSRRDAGVQLLPKAECEPQKHIREFRIDGPTDLAVGSVLKAAEVFKKIKKTIEESGKKKEIEAHPNVDVIGTSKGRGFTGVMKRWNFGGLPAAHGAKKVHRQQGSTSSLASNRGSGRPKRGKKLPGQYGAERVTIRNLTIVKIDEENNLVLVKGAVPGPNGGLVMIRPTNKRA